MTKIHVSKSLSTTYHHTFLNVWHEYRNMQLCMCVFICVHASWWMCVFVLPAAPNISSRASSLMVSGEWSEDTRTHPGSHLYPISPNAINLTHSTPRPPPTHPPTPPTPATSLFPPTTSVSWHSPALILAWHRASTQIWSLIRLLYLLVFTIPPPGSSPPAVVSSVPLIYECGRRSLRYHATRLRFSLGRLI